jgi:hypothetical protein
MKPYAGSNAWVTPRQPAAVVLAAAVVAAVVAAAAALGRPAVT